MLIIRPHKALVCIAFQWGHDFATSGFPTRPLFSLDAFLDAFAKTSHHSADGGSKSYGYCLNSILLYSWHSRDKPALDDWPQALEIILMQHFFQLGSSLAQFEPPRLVTSIHFKFLLYCRWLTSSAPFTGYQLLISFPPSTTLATCLREADITILSAVTWQHSTSSCDSTTLEDVLCACSAYEKRPVILTMSATAPESPPLAISKLRHLHSIGMTLGHTKLASLDATSSSTDKSF
ncbi:hypothetical protein C8J56DRAFT_1064213 [Mycena floridula]|nr:hypothetical protein C8J56DRAFT_1064213 [Mycena floridula]